MSKTRRTITVATNIAAEYNPRDTDTKFTGGEPLFLEQPSTDTRQGTLIQTLNWYSRYADRKMAKEWLLDFASNAGVSSVDIKNMRRIHERDYDLSLAWIARSSQRGLELTDLEKNKIGSHLQHLIATTQKLVPETTPTAETSTPERSRPSVQDIMRERASEAAGEIEGLFDTFMTTDKPQPTDVNIIGILTQRNILPQHVAYIANIWHNRKTEYESIQSDAQLKEAYSHLGKVAIRNMIKWCDAVIASLQSYISVKKANAKPRKRKTVPIEKVVAKVKYLKQFSDAAINLTSLHPSKIVGATELWAYDTAKRKLWYFIADSHVGTLNIKGTAILGYDSSQSGMKTLRKPAEILKKLMTAGKPTARKLFKEITSVHAPLNGRTNESLVILKAY